MVETRKTFCKNRVFVAAALKRRAVGISTMKRRGAGRVGGGVVVASFLSSESFNQTNAVCKSDGLVVTAVFRVQEYRYAPLNHALMLNGV